MKKKIIILFATVLLFIIPTIVSKAYVLMTAGYDSKDIVINTTYFVDSEYNVAVVGACFNWDFVADANINGSVSGGSAPYENVLYSGTFGDTFYGRYIANVTSSDPDHRAASFDIQINDYYCSGKSNDYKRSVMLHELGHAWGLADHTGTYYSVMNVNNLPGMISSVQTDDINGINASW